MANSCMAAIPNSGTVPHSTKRGTVPLCVGLIGYCPDVDVGGSN